jgi:GxxExxY protein
MIMTSWTLKRMTLLARQWRCIANWDVAAVYQEALKEEMSSRGILFRAEVEMPIFYKGKLLKTSYRSDFVCNDSVIVELKAISKLGDIESAQVLNYLRAGRIERGLLFNFGSKSLEHRRFIQSSLTP